MKVDHFDDDLSEFSAINGAAEGPVDGSHVGATAGAIVDFTRWASIVQSFSNLHYPRDDHP